MEILYEIILWVVPVLGFTPVYKNGMMEFTHKNNLQVVAVLNFTPIYKKGVLGSHLFIRGVQS